MEGGVLVGVVVVAELPGDVLAGTAIDAMVETAIGASVDSLTDVLGSILSAVVAALYPTAKPESFK